MIRYHVLFDLFTFHVKTSALSLVCFKQRLKINSNTLKITQDQFEHPCTLTSFNFCLYQWNSEFIDDLRRILDLFLIQLFQFINIWTNINCI